MNNKKERLDKKALSYLKIKGFIFFINMIILSIISFVLIEDFEWNTYYKIVIIPLIGYGLYKFLIFPKLFYKNFNFEIEGDRVYITSGAIIISKAHIPLFRIQHTQSEQGPILLKFKLAKITIHTAGSAYIIPALNQEYAEEVRDKIAFLVKELKENDEV